MLMGLGEAKIKNLLHLLKFIHVLHPWLCMAYVFLLVLNEGEGFKQRFQGHMMK